MTVHWYTYILELIYLLLYKTIYCLLTLKQNYLLAYFYPLDIIIFLSHAPWTQLTLLVYPWTIYRYLKKEAGHTYSLCMVMQSFSAAGMFTQTKIFTGIVKSLCAGSLGLVFVVITGQD